MSGPGVILHKKLKVDLQGMGVWGDNLLSYACISTIQTYLYR